MAGSMFDPDYAASKAVPLSELTVSASGVRRLPIKDSLARALREAVTAVYGPDYRVDVMSAAQPEGPKGTKGTTGTRRHGTAVAADIWVYSPEGKRLKGDELIPLGQHWLGTKQGSVGFPAKSSSSMHLDFIGGTGPDAIPLGRGEGRVWYYGNPTKEQRTALAQSAGQGVLPKYAFEPEIVRKGLIPPGSIAAGKAPIPLDMPKGIRDKRTALDAINAVSPLERVDTRGSLVGYAPEPQRTNAAPSVPARRPETIQEAMQQLAAVKLTAKGQAGAKAEADHTMTATRNDRTDTGYTAGAAVGAKAELTVPAQRRAVASADAQAGARQDAKGAVTLPASQYASPRTETEVAALYDGIVPSKTGKPAALSATADPVLGAKRSASLSADLMGDSFDPGTAGASLGARGEGTAALTLGPRKSAQDVLKAGPQVPKPKLGQSLDEMMDDLDPDAPKIAFDEKHFPRRATPVNDRMAVMEFDDLDKFKDQRVRMADTTRLPDRRPETRQEPELPPRRPDTRVAMAPQLPARRPDSRVADVSAPWPRTRPASLGGRSGNALTANSGRTTQGTQQATKSTTSQKVARDASGRQLYQSAGYVFVAKEGGGYEQVGKVKDGKAVLYS